MNKRQFELSAQLFKTLGYMKIAPEQSLHDELSLGQEISFWDILASYLVLYRFPLLFPPSGKFSWQETCGYWLRPFKGLAGRFRDLIIYLVKKPAARAQWPQGKKVVLFLGFTPTFYRDVLQPVAEFLTRNYQLHVVVIGQYQNFLISETQHNEVSFQSIWEYWGSETKELARVMTKNLGKVKKGILDKIQSEKLTPEMLNRYGDFALRKEFFWVFWSELRRLIPQLAIAKHLLDKNEPALIISADDADQRCRIYSLLAKKKGIPTLLVQQGLSVSHYPEWAFLSHDIVAAMGESSRMDMISQGVSQEKIIVTGNPGFDRLALPEEDVRGRLRVNLKLSDNKKIILFTSQPYYVGVFTDPKIRQTMIKAIADAASRIKDVALIVKPHPGDSVKELKKSIGKGVHATIVEKSTNISRLIKSCDVLITFSSTTGLEALYVGKPVINVEFPNSGVANLYSASGATWVAHSTDEIATHIQNLINDRRNDEMASRESARQSFLRRMSHLPDGQAAERVSKIALNMVRG